MTADIMIEYFRYTFFTNALMAISLMSICAALIGTYIISRRLVSICGGITHSCFGGLGLGYFLGWNPLALAALFAIGSSAAVEWSSRRYGVREDSAIAVTWAVGMALGVLFVFLTPGNVPELNAFLFGNILTVGKEDLLYFTIFTIILSLFFALCYRKIVAVAFDRDFAEVSGMPVRLISYTMTVMVAICIVLTIRIVGVMLLVSVLSLPMLGAEVWCHRFGTVATLSGIICLLCSAGGLILSTVVEVPCSALIVLLMAAVFVAMRTTKSLIFRFMPLKNG